MLPVEVAPFALAATLALAGEFCEKIVTHVVALLYEAKEAQTAVQALEQREPHTPPPAKPEHPHRPVGLPGYARATELARLVSWGVSAVQAFAVGIGPLVSALFLVRGQPAAVLLGYCVSVLLGLGLFTWLVRMEPENYHLYSWNGVSRLGWITIALNLLLGAGAWLYLTI